MKRFQQKKSVLSISMVKVDYALLLPYSKPTSYKGILRKERTAMKFGRNILFYLFLLIAASGWSQTLPLSVKGLTTNRLDLLLRFGFSRFSQGVAPFGTNGNGQAIWPLKEYPQRSVRPGSAYYQGWRGLLGREILKVLELMNCSPKLIPVDFSQYRAALRHEPIAPKTAAPHLRPNTSPRLSRNELETFQTAFLRDCVRHAKAVSEGDNLRAMQLSINWQHVAIAHPGQMEDISFRGARYVGLPNFEAWIDGSAMADWRALGKTGLPPILLNPNNTPPPVLPAQVQGSPTVGPTISAVASAIYSKMNIWGNLNALQLDSLANDLDLEGPGAKTPMLDIIQDLTQGATQDLQNLASLLSSRSNDVAQDLADKIQKRLETDWGAPLAADKVAKVKDLAQRIIQRLMKEVDLQLGT